MSVESKSMIFLFALAIGITGVSSLSTTTQYILGTDRNYMLCKESARSKIIIQTLVLIILSVIAIIIGFNTKKILEGSSKRLLKYSLIIFGFIGILYAISLNLDHNSTFTKMLVSWLVFLFFIGLGYYYVKNPEKFKTLKYKN